MIYSDLTRTSRNHKGEIPNSNNKNLLNTNKKTDGALRENMESLRSV